LVLEQFYKSKLIIKAIINQKVNDIFIKFPSIKTNKDTSKPYFSIKPSKEYFTS